MFEVGCLLCGVWCLLRVVCSCVAWCVLRVVWCLLCVVVCDAC